MSLKVMEHNQWNTIGGGDAYRVSNEDLENLPSLENKHIMVLPTGYGIEFQEQYTKFDFKDFKGKGKFTFISGSQFLSGAARTFSDCINMTEVNVSALLIISSRFMDLSYMFSGCTKLEAVDMSFKVGGTSDYTNDIKVTGIFSGCSSLKIVYVRDANMKQKIENSTYFPSQAQVMIK